MDSQTDFYTYSVPAVSGDPDWSQVECAPICHVLWRGDPGIPAYAQLCRGSRQLYVRLYAQEREPLARFTGDFDMVCCDSCLEFFFCPLPEDPRYFNFECNANGAMYLGFGENAARNVRQVLPNPREYFQIQSFSDADGWGVTFSIPDSFFTLYLPSFRLYNGLELRGNFYKCGNETAFPHYLAWNPVQSPKPDFHLPQFFGILRF